jgi:hypothetical protein
MDRCNRFRNGLDRRYLPEGLVDHGAHAAQRRPAGTTRSEAPVAFRREQ